MKLTSSAATAAVVLSCLALSACFNLPTQPSQITSAYVSPNKYTNYDCSQLTIEQDSLARQENMLVSAQAQRIKSSKFQAFWLGYGQGDGLEASQLANVRGDEEAVRKAEQTKSCHA